MHKHWTEGKLLRLWGTKIVLDIWLRILHYLINIIKVQLLKNNSENYYKKWLKVLFIQQISRTFPSSRTEFRYSMHWTSSLSPFYSMAINILLSAPMKWLIYITFISGITQYSFSCDWLCTSSNYCLCSQQSPTWCSSSQHLDSGKTETSFFVAPEKSED